MTGIDQYSDVRLLTGDERICAYPVPVDWTGQEIKNRRLARGWDQARLAAELGVSRRAVTNWENGHAEPRGENRRRLDAVLGDAAQQDVTLQGATDAQFIAELARRLARTATPPGLPEEDLWWPRSQPKDGQPARGESPIRGDRQG